MPTTSVRRPFAAAWLALVTFGFAQTGCSWMFVDKRPDDYQRRPTFECTESYAAPVIDGLTAVLFLAIAYNAGTEKVPQDQLDDQGRATLMSLAIAGLYGVSAGSGFAHVGQCNTAKEQVAMMRNPPPSYYGGYYGYPPYGVMYAPGGAPTPQPYPSPPRPAAAYPSAAPAPVAPPAPPAPVAPPASTAPAAPPAGITPPAP
ncbi:MAG TPA: hypothetical protein VHK47_12230 [Polyangia bacterium]|jgi:hypothetical protein|nr:hypothetical protein [Polyangia bacterium]